MKRVSYDTSIKHITRHGLLQDILTKEEIVLIPMQPLGPFYNNAPYLWDTSQNEIVANSL